MVLRVGSWTPGSSGDSFRHLQGKYSCSDTKSVGLFHLVNNCTNTQAITGETADSSAGAVVATPNPVRQRYSHVFHSKQRIATEKAEADMSIHLSSVTGDLEKMYKSENSSYYVFGEYVLHKNVYLC